MRIRAPRIYTEEGRAIKNAKARAWYQTNKEKIRAKAHDYFVSNRESIRLKQQIYNRNKSAAREKKNYPMDISEPHTFKQRHLCLKNRARAKNGNYLHPDHDFNIESKLHAECILKTATTGILHNVDHIIPTALGGLHHHLNLQVLPHKINAAKSHNPIWKMDGYKSWKDVPDFLWPESLKPVYRALLNVHY